ncbi:Imm8 family immunity protein [Ignatzschineria sp. LJL83]
MSFLTLRDISSNLINLKTWNPEPEDINLSLDLTIAFDDTDGINYFYVSLVSPQALMKIDYKRLFLLTGKHTLLISHYNYDLLYDTLKDIVRKCDEGDYVRSCSSLCKYFGWEYDSYFR